MGQTFTVQAPAGVISGSAHGSGSPLLMLHGGPGLTDYLVQLSDEVAGWRWISYQQRGLPPSTEAGPFTVEQNVADAIAVLDELGIDQAVVLGHSWGGYLALQLAASHQDRVTGLVIVDPLGAVGDGGFGEMGQQMLDRMAPASAAEYAKVNERLASPDATDDDFLASLALLWPSYYADPATAPPLPSYMRGSGVTYIQTFSSIAEQQAAGFADRLGALTRPAVFVLGGRSPMPVSAGQQTAALLPHAEVQLAPTAGHMPWHEEPGCVATALRRLSELLGD
jgi:pimeloyl-ACP methyl ester carboxylesterase